MSFWETGLWLGAVLMTADLVTTWGPHAGIRGHRRSQTMESTTRRTFESLAQAAERTKLSTRTLRRRIADGSLPAYRVGPLILRVDPDEVDRLLVRLPATERWQG